MIWDFEINKWVVMTMLQERNCVSYDKWNYEMMQPRIEKQMTVFGKLDTMIVVDFGGAIKEKISLNDYKVKLREYKIEQVIGE